MDSDTTERFVVQSNIDISVSRAYNDKPCDVFIELEVLCFTLKSRYRRYVHG